MVVSSDPIWILVKQISRVYVVVLLPDPPTLAREALRPSSYVEVWPELAGHDL